MRTIDIHAHLTPQRFQRAVLNGKDWHGMTSAEGELFNPRNAWTPQQRIADMDSLGGAVQVVSTNDTFNKYDQDDEVATLMQRELTPVFVPLGQHALGVALLVIGAVTLLVGMRVAGVLSIIFGTLSFYHRLYTFEDRFAEQPEFFVSLALFLAAYVTAERVVAMSNAGALPQTATEGTLRTVFVSLAALMGLLGLNAWAPPELLSLYWLGLALISMTLGTVVSSCWGTRGGTHCSSLPGTAPHRGVPRRSSKRRRHRAWIPRSAKPLPSPPPR